MITRSNKCNICGIKYHYDLPKCPRCCSSRDEIDIFRWVSVYRVERTEYNCLILITRDKLKTVVSCKYATRVGFLGIFIDLIEGYPKLVIDISLNDIADILDVKKSLFGVACLKTIVKTKAGVEFEFKKFPKYERRKLEEMLKSTDDLELKNYTG